MPNCPTTHFSRDVIGILQNITILVEINLLSDYYESIVYRLEHNYWSNYAVERSTELIIKSSTQVSFPLFLPFDIRMYHQLKLTGSVSVGDECTSRPCCFNVQLTMVKGMIYGLCGILSVFSWVLIPNISLYHYKLSI